MESAIIQHGKLLEAHSHIIIGDKLNVPITHRSVQVHNFEHSLSLLQQNESLFVLVSHGEVVGGICQFSENDWNLALINFYFSIVHRVEGVLILGRFIVLASVTTLRGPWCGFRCKSGQRAARSWRFRLFSGKVTKRKDKFDSKSVCLALTMT